MAKQTGAEYREKNRIRLQRFYEKQAASGKKRISALVSDGIHGHLMAEKDRTGMSISEIIEAALSQRYGGQEVTHFNESTAGHDGIPDVDDVSEDYLTAYGGPDPETPSGTQEPADPGPDLDTPESDQGELVTDDTSGGDQAEPAALVDQESDTPIDEPELAPQGDDLIPEWTHPEITRETDKAERKKTQAERDKILVMVDKELPGPSNSQVRADLLNQKGIPVSLRPGQYGGTWTGKKFTDNLGHAKKRLGVK
ncbi:MAG: hypothetical protein K9K87_09490 [Desulfotignum sp.]|nr:hypothetical protein [Desulfotignum sp.]